MMRRALDLILLVITIVGAVLAWQTGRERARLQGDYDRLARKTGDLAVADPTRIVARALKTGEPLHFAWRVYMPGNVKRVFRYSTGGQSSSWSQDPAEFIARARVREDERGVLQVYTNFSGGSMQSGLGDRALADLLRGRWDEVVVEQLGDTDVVAVEPDRPATFLRLKLPEGLAREAEAKLPPHLRKGLPVLFEWGLDPIRPKP